MLCSARSAGSTLGRAVLRTARSSSRPLVTYRAMSSAAGGGAGGAHPSMMGPGAEDLRGMSCKLLGGCSKDTPLVPQGELAARLASVPQWSLSVDERAISRRFTARNFVAATQFFSEVCKVAEEENHHPDLHLTNYREVEVVLSTHAVGGLTVHDFIVAAKLDAVPVDYSPKWLKKQLAEASEGDKQT